MGFSTWTTDPRGWGHGEHVGWFTPTRNSQRNPPSGSTTTQSIYPAGFNSLCPTCSFLVTKYGPNDWELIAHCQDYYGRKDISDSNHYYPGDSSNPNLNESNPAN